MPGNLTMIKIKPGLLLLLVIVCASVTAQADTGIRYNQVHLQAQQSESVSNDTMHATLNTYGEVRDPAKLAAQINSDMEWALQTAKTYEDVSASTGSYQTWPVYRDKVLKGWRGQQSLELEGKDTQRIGQLVGRLQEKLQVKTIRFSVSDQKRHDVENRLIGRALDAFKRRAGIIGDNLQATGYRIVDINVNTSTQRPPMPYQPRVAAASMANDTAVAVEAGESEVRVTISGTIELQLP